MFSATAALLTSTYPGAEYLHPTIHFTPDYVSNVGGWHDVAGALTHKGVHHVFQGTGWNHAKSSDLVRWSMAPHGPKKIHETYKGMISYSDPCSGFLTKDPDDGGRVCAGFRQCGSNKGVVGMPHNWDVPLELRCAVDDDLNAFNDSAPEYLFNVSFWRAVPYDPARPWREPDDGHWYVLLSFDACNATAHPHGCAAGGMLGMWRSPALRGSAANWVHVGDVFISNVTVLQDGHLTKEFVTIDYIGKLPNDPKPEGLGTRIFLNNVGGNGGGVGCCSGTTSYFVVEQEAAGAPLKEVAPQGMVDWGAFRLKTPPPPTTASRATEVEETATRARLDLLDGTGSRGLSMARTLGSEEADQVTQPGRRVLIGWTGPADVHQLGGQGSAQSLPRELSLAPDRSLLQAFVPELQALRIAPPHAASGASAWFPTNVGLQAEVIASLPGKACAAAHAGCGVALLEDELGATIVTLDASRGLVLVDAKSQSNTAVRAGPLPPMREGPVGWTIHAIVDHSLVEVIVNNATALVVYAAPSSANAGRVRLVGAPEDAKSASIVAWRLKGAGHEY